MKKKIKIISMLLFSLFLVVGCGNKKEDNVVNLKGITIEIPTSEVNFEMVPGKNDIVTAEVGKTFQLIIGISPENTTNKDLKWKVSNNTILSVGSKGKVTALKEGTASITATSLDGKVKSNTIEIKIVNKTAEDSE